MIGKVPRPGRGFRGLVSYLLRGSRGRPEADRVAWTATRNLVTDDPKHAWRLMAATAKRSRRVRLPVYHLVISWHHQEAPTADLMRQVADTTCCDLGLAEHQLLFIAHADTHHRHVHIVANRVHPETGIAWRTSHDFRTIERSLRRQAEAHGLAIVPGRHTEPERFRHRGARVRDADFQRQRTSDEGHLKVRWSNEHLLRQRPRLLDIIAKATSWQQLDQTLLTAGFALAPKGQGVVIVDTNGTAKLSQLGKGIRLADLEQRFGEDFHAHLTKREAPEPEAVLAWERLAAMKLTEEAVRFPFVLYRMGLLTKRDLEQQLADPEATEQTVLPDLQLLDQTASKDIRTAQPEATPADLRTKTKPVARRSRDRELKR